MASTEQVSLVNMVCFLAVGLLHSHTNMTCKHLNIVDFLVKYWVLSLSYLLGSLIQKWTI